MTSRCSKLWLTCIVSPFSDPTPNQSGFHLPTGGATSLLCDVTDEKADEQAERTLGEIPEDGLEEHGVEEDIPNASQQLPDADTAIRIVRENTGAWTWVLLGSVDMGTSDTRGRLSSCGSIQSKDGCA